MSNQESRQESQGRNWYAVQTNPGYEKTVLKNLKQRIETLGVQDYIFDVVIPTKIVKKIKNGKEVEVEENIYPGYVLVDMIVNDRTWLIVRNTPRVSGILGTGIHPVPITETEMANALDFITKKDDKNIIVEDFQVGDLVRIKSGPFAGSEGKIKTIDSEKKEVVVLLDFFGKETEVSLNFSGIEKV